MLLLLILLLLRLLDLLLGLFKISYSISIFVAVDDLFPKIIDFLLDLFVVFEKVHLVSLFVKEVVHVLINVFEENSDDSPAHLQSNTFMFEAKRFLQKNKRTEFTIVIIKEEIIGGGIKVYFGM